MVSWRNALLAFGMLLSGCINTISKKAQNKSRFVFSHHKHTPFFFLLFISHMFPSFQQCNWMEYTRAQVCAPMVPNDHHVYW